MQPQTPDLEVAKLLAGSSERVARLGELLGVERARVRIKSIEQELRSPEVWEDHKKMAALQREMSRHGGLVELWDSLAGMLGEAEVLQELVAQEEDQDLVAELGRIARDLHDKSRELEFASLFDREGDEANAFVQLQAGAGGVESQDWTEMLVRMYVRFGERKGFKVAVVDRSPGETAGLKGCVLQISGDFAYGWLRTESGVHRLVRKSPFDAGNKRHTSFASVEVTPEADDTIEIDIDPADVRVDTYRASGAGGQHVNKTDSAVRLTHEPTKTVVQCQSERSQHQNRERCWAMLRARLYQIELDRRIAAKAEAAGEKASIGWGSQIRSYVLDDARIKDLRTKVEVTDCNAVLDGDLDIFIDAALRAETLAGNRENADTESMGKAGAGEQNAGT